MLLRINFVLYLEVMRLVVLFRGYSIYESRFRYIVGMCLLCNFCKHVHRTCKCLPKVNMNMTDSNKI